MTYEKITITSTVLPLQSVGYHSHIHLHVQMYFLKFIYFFS